MRIVIVSQHFHPEPFRISDLATWLSERGHDVSVLTGQPNYPAGGFYPGYRWIRPLRSSLGRVSIHRVPVVPRGRGGGIRLSLNFLSFALSGVMLGPWLRLGKPEAILCFLPSPVTAAVPAILLRRLRRAPLALWVQDLWPESVCAVGMLRSGLLLRAIDRLVGFIYRHADAIWISSPAFEPAIARYGIPPRRIAYIPNSAEDSYGAVPPQGERAAPDGSFVIMYAGNMGEAQGLDTVLDAVARIPAARRIHWLFVGDGRRRSWLADQVTRRGLRQVSIRDRVPPEDMPRLIAATDALLVTLRPDPLFALSIPSKLQSALASAKPILAVLAGPAAAMVEEAGAGIVAPPGDAAALAQAASDLAGMTAERRRQTGAAGRGYYLAYFDRQRVYGRIEAELLSLCRQHAPPARPTEAPLDIAGLSG